MVSAWVLAHGPAHAQPFPALTEGKLENGLRYQIMEAPQATGVSLRLRVWVGAQEEAREELGAAHFVEHMVFRGTRGRPQGDIDAVLAKRGVTIGRDHNAFTGRFDTTYHLDLPRYDADDLALGLGWLSEIADGALFRAADVEIERGVVLAERRGTITPQTPTNRAEAAFHNVAAEDYDREVAGTPESLARLDAAQLRAFYRKWYRPDNSLLVIAGPVDAQQIQEEVKERFGDWAATGPKPDFTRLHDLAPLAEPAVLVLPPTRSPRRSLVCESAPVVDRGPEADLMDAVLEDILAQRLVDAIQGQADIYSLSSLARSELATTTVYCISAAHGDGAGAQALAIGQQAMRVLRDAGPSQAELDRAMDVQRAYVRGEGAAPPGNVELADELLALAFAGEPYRTPNEKMRRLNRFAETLKPADVQAAISRLWPAGTQPRLSIEDAQAPEAAALVNAWRAGQEAPIQAPQAGVAAAFPDAPLLELGRPGKVVRREALEPDFTRLTFANGVVLNVKRTEFAGGRSHVVVLIGDGRRGLSPTQRLAGELGAVLMVDGGLERMGAAQLARRYATVDWRFDAFLKDDATAFEAAIFSANLPFALHVMAAYLQAPGFSAELVPALAAYAEQAADVARTDPAQAAHQALVAKLWPQEFEREMAPSAIAALQISDLKAALAQDFSRGLIEVTIVGDVSEVAAREAVAASFGALRGRRTRAPLRAQYLRLSPDRPAFVLEAEHEGPANAAAAELRWPLFVDEYGPRDRRLQVAVLAGLLENEVTTETRRRRGMTYTPDITLDLPLAADQGFIIVGVESAEGDLDVVVRGVRQAAARLANGEITPAMLDAVRRPIEADVAAARRENASWAWLLSGSSRDPRALPSALGGPDALERLTLDDVRAAAAQWLSPEPFVALARPTATASRPGDAP